MNGWTERGGLGERLMPLFRIEALLLGLLVLKLTLTGLWLVAGPAAPGGGQAVAAEQPKAAAPAKQGSPASELSLLERQREELRRREERLQRREAEVEALASEVEARLDQLAALQAKLREELSALSGEKSKARTKRIKQLVQVYSSMKAEKAAGLIDKMDEGVVVEIFSQMPSDSAGKILSFVEPEKAARISQRLAGVR